MSRGEWLRSRPETRYVEVAGGHVAYQVFGSGDRDIVFITNGLTHLDAIWDEPSAARFFDRLAGMGRIIRYDMRGAGVSDPVPGEATWQPVEEVVDDIIGVLDAVTADRVVAYGDTEGGLFAAMLAASYPRRVSSLVLVNAFAHLLRRDDYPIGIPEEVARALSELYVAQHGTTGDMLQLTAPSMADDTRFRSWWVRYMRSCAPLGLVKGTFDWFGQVDVRAALPLIAAPTLVIARRHAQYHLLGYSEYLAAHIPEAELRVLPGADTLPFHAGDFDTVLDEVEPFVTGRREAPPTDRVLATVVFTDIVDSTATAARLGDRRWRDLLYEHDRIVRAEILRFRGSEIEVTGDGSLSTFDGPARAVKCAAAIAAQLEQMGISVRAGVHTGEVERTDTGIRGLGVHIASRVMSAAPHGGVVVSGTVRDLVVGSGLQFDELGSFDLKGVPGSWNLLRLRG
jgi:class 3 adenylate cyclase/pimeloyl-ACP methyl ester carboxylesterase